MGGLFYRGIDLAKVLASGGALKWKPIPIGSSVTVEVNAGTPAGTEFNAYVEPDDGYKLDLSEISVTVPADVEVNLLVEVEGELFPLMADNQTSDFTVTRDDFAGFGIIDKLILYIKTTADITADEQVVMVFKGRQVG